MASYGSIAARVFTSEARIPIVGAAITFTRPGADGETLLAVRLTNFDGLTEPVDISAPDAAESQSYSPGAVPFAQVDVAVEAEFYDRVLVRGAQIFSDTQSMQNLQLIPTPTLPASYTQTQTFPISAQEL